MNTVKDLASLAGNVLNLIVGDNFITPASDVIKKHPQILLYW